MYKTLHKKQGSVTVQLRFARSSVTFCAKRDNTGGVFKNLFKTPESKLDVVCDADSCRYNEDHCCCAGKIDIRGEGACDCGETCCGTFEQG